MCRKKIYTIFGIIFSLVQVVIVTIDIINPRFFQLLTDKKTRVGSTFWHAILSKQNLTKTTPMLNATNLNTPLENLNKSSDIFIRYMLNFASEHGKKFEKQTLQQLENRFRNREVAKINRNLKKLDKNQPFEKKLPEFMIIGAKKCGTGALSYFLSLHPHLQYCGERYYFTRFKTEPLSWYRNQMPYANYKDIVFDKNPNYFYQPEIAKDIKKMIPNIKLAVVLCDPVNRIYSDYLHIHRYEETTPKEKLIKFTNEVRHFLPVWDSHESSYISKKVSYFEIGKVWLRSLYSLYLSEWLEVFPDLMVIDGDVFKTDPFSVLQ